MQMTFDGFVAGPNNEMDWLIGGDEEWALIFEDLQSVDTMLVGGNMYPEYFSFWQSMLDDKSAPVNLAKYAELASRTPHIIFSKTLQKADWPNIRIARDVSSEIASLKQQAGKDIIVWGGATFAGDLINKGLIDEYRITLNPTILGGGKALFKDVKNRRRLQLIDARPLPSGIIVLRYKAWK